MHIYQIESLYRKTYEVMIGKGTFYKTESLTITSCDPKNKDEPITLENHQGFCRPKEKDGKLGIIGQGTV